MTTFGTPIIAIDDNEDDILLLERLLQRAGVQPPLVGFHSAEQAMAWLDGRADGAEVNPFAIFLDLDMPGLSAFELLKWIRRRKSLADTAVIVLSTSDERLDVERAYGLDAQCFLIKHTSATEIAQVIDDARLFARDPAHRSALFSGQFNRIVARDLATRTVMPLGVRP